jgi:hypothetical protein
MKEAGNGDMSSDGPPKEKDGPGVGRPKRAHKPNTKYTGSSWA